MSLAVLAEVVRSGFVEGRHRGSAVALGPRGEVVLAVGEPQAPVFPRSSNKLFQAAGMVRAGRRRSLFERASVRLTEGPPCPEWPRGEKRKQ